jgi:hypothetical protein
LIDGIFRNAAVVADTTMDINDNSAEQITTKDLALYIKYGIVVSVGWLDYNRHLPLTQADGDSVKLSND